MRRSTWAAIAVMIVLTSISVDAGRPPGPPQGPVVAPITRDDVGVQGRPVAPDGYGQPPGLGTTLSSMATGQSRMDHPVPAAPAPAIALRDHWRTEGDWYQSTLRNAGAADSITAGARLAGVPLDELPRAQSNLPALAAAVAALPPALAGPVGDLAAEVSLATARNRAAIHGSPSDLEHFRTLDAELRQAGVRDRLSPVQAADARARIASVRWMIDSRAQYSAAWALAQAVDRDLPLLEAAARALPHRATPVPVACDVLDIAPAICVGGNVDHVYPAGSDYALQVTLGGTNVYHNLFAGPVLSAGLAIDLGLDTTIAPTITSDTQPCAGASSVGIGLAVVASGLLRLQATRGQTVVCAGAASGGVGLFLDRSAGSTWDFGTSDATRTQTLTAVGYGGVDGLGIAVRLGPLRSTVHANSSLVAGYASQRAFGYGVGIGGAGLFVAQDGDLDLSLTADVALPPSEVKVATDAEVEGFGVGALGTGLAVLGQGAHHKVRVAASEEHGLGLKPTTVLAAGLGQSVLGTGVFIDADGASSLTLSGSRTGANKLPDLTALPNPDVAVYGLGAASSGVAALLKTGPATMVASARQEVDAGWARHLVNESEGFASLAGTAVLAQSGGPATFRLEALSVATSTNRSFHSRSGPVRLTGQGAAEELSAALVTVAGGSDNTYVAAAQSTLDGVAMPDTAPPFAAVQGSGAAVDVGPSVPVGSPGVGFLFDDGGCDHFQSSPPATTQAGVRGGTFWLDSSGYGGGADGGSSGPCA